MRCSISWCASKQAGHGLLLITHDLAEAQRADRAIVLSAGTVGFDGGLPELLAMGTTLTEWGLEVPPLARLAGHLRERGVPVPENPSSPAALVEALCP